jgi:hypothetical protein
MYLFSVHSPTDNENEPRESYVEESRLIVAEICARVPPSVPLVIGGDFNFKSFGERLTNESVRTERSELEALADFRRRDLFVAWRDLHPGEPLPQTLRWNGDRTRPYHCDGYLTRGLTETAMFCDVIAPNSEINRSDHNPVILRWA